MVPLYCGWSVLTMAGAVALLGSYQTALWCLVAQEGIAAVSVLGGRALRDDP